MFFGIAEAGDPKEEPAECTVQRDRSPERAMITNAYLSPKTTRGDAPIAGATDSVGHSDDPIGNK